MEKQFSDLIILLASGINQRQMYFDNHPKVQALSREFLMRWYDLLKMQGKSEFRFGVFEGKFIRKGKYLVGPSIAGRSLIRFAEYLHCGGFSLSQPLDPVQLINLFRLAADLNEETGNLEQSRQLFLSEGITGVRLLEPYRRGASGALENQDETEAAGAADSDEKSESPEESILAEEFLPLLQVYQALYENVSGNNKAVGGDSKIDLDRARAQGEELVAVSDKGALDVMQFMRYPDFDSYTIGHSVRVAALASLMGRQLGFSADQRAELATAGLLHDLGKGRIPGEILFKPGKLDDGERKIMETHPVIGTKILLANGEQNSVVLAAAWGHHIRFDGGGYPKMPGSYRNSVAACLVHICDVFEALTASRPYKKPLPPRKAYEIMLTDTGAFEPHLLAALVRSMGLYPPGSEVLLSDGRKAVVVAAGQDPENPLVRITHDDNGLALSTKNQEALSLALMPEMVVEEVLAVGVEEETSV